MAGKKKVVVVEDDTFLAKVYKSKFKELPYTFFYASDGEEGLEVIKKEEPSLVLLDLIMPKMDGFEVLEAMRKIPSLKSTKVIVLTNLGQDEDQKRCASLGAIDYIVKSDVPISDVVDLIKKHVG